MTDLMIGATLNGRYRVTEVLAEGAMGRVYKGHHVSLDRLVAIKCILPRYSRHSDLISRFEAEARLLSQLSHPNVVAIYDFGCHPTEFGEQLFLVMEFLSGPSLEDVLEAGPLDLARAVNIQEQLLLALDFAHGHNVVHRDVKPANVVLEPLGDGWERVKVIDFGIARAGRHSGASSGGLLLGTPQFMAPEQIRGEAVGPETDVYAAGIVLFNMLTGRLPFNEEELSLLLDKQLAAPRPDPRQIAPGRRIPESLARACLRALEIEPGARFADASEFAATLVEIQRSGALGSRSSRPVPEPGRSSPPTIARSSPGVRGEASGLGSLPRGATLGNARSRIPPDFGSLLNAERVAREMVERRDLDAALSVLGEGLRAAEQALAQGERELGEAALGTFVSQMASILLKIGKAAAVRELLEERLPRVSTDDPARPLLLKYLAFAERDMGHPGLAERLRQEAMTLGARHGNRRLVEELEQPISRQRSGPVPSRWAPAVDTSPASRKSGS